MEKKVLCSHCGNNSTPVWPNRLAGKPWLCKACGSTYVFKGRLGNYVPNLIRSTSSRNLGGVNSKSNLNNVTNSGRTIRTIPAGKKSELCWNVPTRKRSVSIKRRHSEMEKFERQLLDLLEQRRLNNESVEDDEILIYDDPYKNKLIPSNEISLGAIPLKPHHQKETHDDLPTDNK